MKYIILLSFILSIMNSFGQSSKVFEEPRVDKRVEILSIVFRLADSEEYSADVYKAYVDKINDHYDPHKNHELIHFVKTLRKEKGLSHDAVMRMAVYIDNNFNPLVSFSDEIPDSRWGKNDAYKFIELLKVFYKDTNSKAFFENNQSLYKEVSKRFFPIYKHLDLSWYSSFYGKEPTEKFVIINALSNGGSNYGVAFDDVLTKRRTIYAIMGTWEMDSLGTADFSLNAYFPTLLHEFNHSFIDYILNSNPFHFKKSGETIFKVVEKKMNSGGYGSWQTMFNEALVRASVIKYMKDHHYPEIEIDQEINLQINVGFLWIKELVEELEEYSKQRNVYPTLESYYPNLLNAYENYAKDIYTYAKQYLTQNSRFVSFNELKNGEQNIDPTTKQLTINFDAPFRGTHFIAPSATEAKFPNIKSMVYSDDAKSVTLEWTLESNTKYGFILKGLSSTIDKNGEQEDYIVDFKTR